MEGLKVLAAILGNKFIIPEYIHLLIERLISHHVTFQTIKKRMEIITGKSFEKILLQENPKHHSRISKSQRPRSSSNYSSDNSNMSSDDSAQTPLSFTEYEEKKENEFMDSELDIMFRDVLISVIGDLTPP